MSIYNDYRKERQDLIDNIKGDIQRFERRTGTLVLSISIPIIAHIVVGGVVENTRISPVRVETTMDK